MLAVACDLRPDDVLLSLLVLGADDRTRLTGVTRNIHKLIDQLKRDYPDLFESFVFTDATAFPYSEQVASALSNLQWSRLLGTENPDFRVHFLKPSAKSAFDEWVRPKLSSDAEDRLTEASRIFWEELSER